MLRFLRIQHLAVIDRLELELDPGLTVLTGETGAGKSILVGAVGLLVGGRASADLVRTGEDQAVIEASEKVLAAPLAQMLLSLSGSSKPSTGMPAGQATLIWLKRNMPRTADKVLAEVRARYSPASS